MERCGRQHRRASNSRWDASKKRWYGMNTAYLVDHISNASSFIHLFEFHVAPLGVHDRRSPSLLQIVVALV